MKRSLSPPKSRMAPSSIASSTTGAPSTPSTPSSWIASATATHAQAPRTLKGCAGPRQRAQSRSALSGRVGDWRAKFRVRWFIPRFRLGPQSGSHAHVSSPRPSNRTCGFPASGSQTRSRPSHSESSHPSCQMEAATPSAPYLPEPAQAPVRIFRSIASYQHQPQGSRPFPGSAPAFAVRRPSAPLAFACGTIRSLRTSSRLS